MSSSQTVEPLSDQFPAVDPLAVAAEVIDKVHARFKAAGGKLVEEDLETLRAQRRVLLGVPSGAEAGAACDTLVRLYDLSGHQDDALGMADAVLRDGFGNAESIMRVLRLIDERRGVRDAHLALRTLSADRAAHPNVQSMWAKIEHKLGMLDAAIERTRAVLASSPSAPMARGILVLSLIDHGAVEEACDTALEAGEGMREFSWAILPLLSAVRETVDAEARFLEIAERFLESDPADRQYWQVQILKQTGDVDRARSVLRSLSEKDPDDERWAIELAKIDLEQLTWAESAERFRRVLGYRGVHEGLRARLRSALEYVDYVAPATAGRPGDDALAVVPDTLFEHVLARHRNLLYRPVPGKIAMVGATMGPGGAERVLGVSFKCLKRAGANVSLWLYSVDSAREDDFYLEELGIGLDEVSVLAKATDIPEPFRWLPYGHSRKAYALYLKILEERPEIVHGWQDGLNVDLVFAAILAGVPRIVLHPHNMRPDLVHRSKIARSFRSVYRAAMKREEVELLCVSDASRNEYVEWIGKEDRSRTHVIYNGFDLDIVEEGEKRRSREQLCELYGVPKERFIVGAAFRFAAVKRPLLWVKIAARVLTRLPEAHFVIFGDGELKAEAEALIAELGLTDRFTLPGRMRDVPRKIALFDVYLLTSESEGLPTVAIEAQYAGVPVVASNAGGVSECFVHGSTGHLVEGDDPERYVDGVMSVFETASMRGGIARRAEAFLKSRFSERTMTASLLRLYAGTDGSAADDEVGRPGSFPANLPSPSAGPVPAERRVDKFMIVMPWGRVGSNLLVSILEQHLRSKAANETLNGIRDADAQIDWLERFYSTDGLPETVSAIYCKQSLKAMVDPGRVERFCVENGIRIIRMSRRNLLKAAVSQMRAGQYAERTKREEGVARWGLLPGKEALGPTSLCTATLLRVLGEMGRSQSALGERFAECDSLDVAYEEIHADLDAVVGRVCTFLGIDRQAYEVKFRKATSDDLETMIVNYDEVMSAVMSSSERHLVAA